MAGQPAARPPEAERFVRDFARVWSAATPTGFSALFDPSIRLIAPLIPVTDGIRAAEAGFADLLGLLPDLAAEVHDWAPTADGVIIDHVFRGTLGRRRVCWRGMDRFVLRGELALERVHYADPRPLLGPALRQPVLWPRLLRARARPGAPPGQSRHRPPGAGPPLELPAAPPDPAAPGGLAVGRVVRRWPGVRARELRRGSRGPLTLAEIELSDGALRWPAVLRTRRAGDRVVAADLFFDPVALAVQVAHPRRLAAAARGGRRRPGREGA